MAAALGSAGPTAADSSVATSAPPPAVAVASASAITTAQKRPPKLRASCDECGAAKVKCDRGQPSCSRCISIGAPCIYGICRKVGKPRRIRQPSVAGTAATSRDEAITAPGSLLSPFTDNASGSTSRLSSAVDGSGTANHWYDDASQKAGLWSAVDSMHLDMPPFDFISDLMDPSFFPTPGTSPVVDDYSINPPSAQVPSLPSPPSQTPNQSPAHPETACVRSVNGSGHDCAREACDILSSLPFNTSAALSASPFTPPAALAATLTCPPLPLDRALSLSREASRKLSTLITCCCARSPHLILLYASIISRILLWYHQAVSSTNFNQRSTSTSSTTSSGSSNNNSGGLWPSGTESRAQSLPNSATSTSPRMSISSEMPPPSSSSISPASADAKPNPFAGPGIAIGTFNVDDVRVHAAIQMQLLSGEIKRIGTLIEQFTSLTCCGMDGGFSDEDTTGGTGTLYQRVAVWLKGIHSTLTNTTRSKLRELETE